VTVDFAKEKMLILAGIDMEYSNPLNWAMVLEKYSKLELESFSTWKSVNLTF